ncbi:rhombosortase [Saccharobesus litoralis]|uniref:Rhombosortase n=1 Tax=Saccharobesus litoralis TaxID=2172099 RepID=A0A2S0VP17_9ALTE|nr:rhombosortase [Saccharobesus litoralis]AWB65933.1 rhombosortase [Saccharobesus litoralis]
MLAIIKQLPYQRQFSLPFITLGALILLTTAGETQLNASWALIPALSNNGEWWRLITGHLVHSNTYHSLLNLGGVLAVWALHGEYYAKYKLAIVSLLLGLAISASIVMWQSYTHYVGFSAILHGLFCFGAIEDIKRKVNGGELILLFVIGKVIWEQIAGGSMQVAELINANVATDAHLFGTIFGCIIGVIYIVTWGKNLPRKTKLLDQ